MTHLSMSALKADFLEVIRRAQEGERFVITRWGKAVADLGPHPPEPTGVEHANSPPA